MRHPRLAAAVIGLAQLTAMTEAGAQQPVSSIEGSAPVITRKKKPSPKQPESMALSLPTRELPSGPVNPLGLLPPQVSGELTLQQGGAAFGAGDVRTDGTSRLGLTLRAPQGSTLWSLRTAGDRLNQNWLMSDFSLVGYFNENTQLNLGDETLSLNPLLMDDLPMRGSTYRFRVGSLTARTLVGQDRPALGGARRERTLGGFSADLPLSNEWMARGSLLAQQDFDRSRAGGALGLGVTYRKGETRLEADLASSVGGEQPDAGCRLQATLPFGPLRWKGRYLRQGSDFLAARNQYALPDGGRESWGAGFQTELGGSWIGYADFGSERLNLARQLTLPEQLSRQGLIGVSHAPPKGLPFNLSFSRSELDTSSQAMHFGLRSDRLSAEQGLALPVAERSRVRWEWSQFQPEGGAVGSQHRLNLYLGGVLATPLEWEESLLLGQGLPARLNHGFHWQGAFWGKRVQGRAGGYYEHPIDGPLDRSSLGGVNGGFWIPFGDFDQAGIEGDLSGNLAGQGMSARWLVRYESRFGSTVGANPAETVTRVGGEVVLPPGLAGASPKTLHVWLDGSRKVPVGPDGRFLFEPVSPGKHVVSLDANQLPLSLAIPTREATRELTIEKGQQRMDLRFELSPAHRVAGRVCTPAGRGVEAMLVRLGGSETRETWTDSEGRYLFDALPNGIYTVKLPGEEAGGFAWEDRTHVLYFDQERSVDNAHFMVFERSSHIPSPLQVSPSEFEPAPARPRAGHVLSEAARLVPPGPRAGQTVTLKVRARQDVQQAFLIVEPGHAIPLRRSRPMLWEARLTWPGGKRAHIRLVSPTGTRRLPLSRPQP